jgi:hypothetical protein
VRTAHDLSSSFITTLFFVNKLDRQSPANLFQLNFKAVKAKATRQDEAMLGQGILKGEVSLYL